GITVHSKRKGHKRRHCQRLGAQPSNKTAPMPRCWFFCFDEERYRVYRRPEMNGVRCRVNARYQEGVCKYSRCIQPGKRRNWYTKFGRK
ncbi:unnamed protein product, partial [Ixodes pacificus]